jgi:MFS family permease
MISVLGVGTALVPFCPNLILLYVCSLISQTGAGAWDNANSIWLIEMWQQRSPAILQFSQFMYGVGTMLGPLLAAPFLIGELRNETETATDSSITTTESTISTTDINLTIDRRPKIEIPFIIGGAIQSICKKINFSKENIFNTFYIQILIKNLYTFQLLLCF